jgi:hypothetical protein
MRNPLDPACRQIRVQNENRLTPLTIITRIRFIPLKLEIKTMLNYLWAKIRSNHFMAMVLCCAIPIAGIAILSYMNIVGSWGSYAIFLLCPLMHIVMMRGMHKPHQKATVMITHDKTDHENQS